MQTEVIVSAPGKVILHGEHSVVYGKVAFASGLDLRCFLRVTLSPDDSITLDLPDVNINKRWTVQRVVQDLLPHIEDDTYNDENCHPVPPSEASLRTLKEFAGLCEKTTETRDLAVISFLYLFCCICGRKDKLRNLPALHFRLLSQLPVGAGLGSSAAFSVCLVSILLKLGGLLGPRPDSAGDSIPGGSAPELSDEDRQLINKWAFVGEKIIHGQPSGIDNSVSTFGGAIRFKNKQITPVEKMPNIKILLTNTKVPRSTKTLVAGVRTRHDKFPEVMSPVLQGMEGLAERSIHVYEQLHSHADTNQYYSQLEELVDINQSLLNAIGVGHPSLDRVVSATLKRGLHTKLTGAGGGGCTYTLLKPETSPETITETCTELRGMGFECWETSIGASGVLFHPDPRDDGSVPQALFS